MNPNFSYHSYSELQYLCNTVFSSPIQPGLLFNYSCQDNITNFTNFSLYLKPQVRIENKSSNIGGTRLEKIFSKDNLLISYSINTSNGLHFDNFNINSSITMNDYIKCNLSLEKDEEYSLELSDEINYYNLYGCKLMIKAMNNFNNFSMNAETGFGYKNMLFTGINLSKVLDKKFGYGLAFVGSLGFIQGKVLINRNLSEDEYTHFSTSLLLLLSRNLTVQFQHEKIATHEFGFGFLYTNKQNQVKTTILANGLINTSFRKQFTPKIAISTSLSTSLAPLSCSPGILFEIQK